MATAKALLPGRRDGRGLRRWLMACAENFGFAPIVAEDEFSDRHWRSEAPGTRVAWAGGFAAVVSSHSHKPTVEKRASFWSVVANGGWFSSKPWR